MPGMRCLNCRWWTGDARYAPTAHIDKERSGNCERITASAALRSDTAARLYPVGVNAWLTTRFDFSCGNWERAAGIMEESK
jgi:hypothetical protein